MKSNGLNVIQHGPDLGTVVMPLVRLLQTDGLSWQNRAEITGAIFACERHWQSMEDEKNQVHQSMAGSQQLAAKGARPSGAAQPGPTTALTVGGPQPGDLDYDGPPSTSNSEPK